MDMCSHSHLMQCCRIGRCGRYRFVRARLLARLPQLHITVACSHAYIAHNKHLPCTTSDHHKCSEVLRQRRARLQDGTAESLEWDILTSQQTAQSSYPKLWYPLHCFLHLLVRLIFASSLTYFQHNKRIYQVSHPTTTMV